MWMGNGILGGKRGFTSAIELRSQIHFKARVKDRVAASE